VLFIAPPHHRLATRLAYDPTISFSAKLKASTGNRLLYGLCMRLAYVWRARRVRNGNFSSMVVQRLNARERNIPSLIQRGLISGFLGRFSIISGFTLISISLSDEPESFISALQDILGQAAIYNKEASNVGRQKRGFSKKGALRYPSWLHLYYNWPRCKPHRPTWADRSKKPTVMPSLPRNPPMRPPLDYSSLQRSVSVLKLSLRICLAHQMHARGMPNP
jgi:hypothetical protein